MMMQSLNSTNTMPTVSVTSNEDILFEQSNDEIIFSVNYIEISFTDGDIEFLHRSEDNDEYYRECCGETFQMPLFPSQLPESSTCRPEFILLSRLTLSVRVRRLVLCDQYEKYSVMLSDLRELEYICLEKWKLYEKRLSQLEEEMVQLKMSDKIQISSRFHALLSNNLGRTTVSIFLQHECHNFLKSKDLSLSESIKGISLADIYYAWEILKYWILIKSVQTQCENGFLDLSLIDNSPLFNNTTYQNNKREYIASDALLAILNTTQYLTQNANNNSSTSLLILLNKILKLILTDNYFHDIIQPTTIQFLKIALEKIQPHDIKSEDMSASLSFLIDDLSNALDSLLLVGLRKNPTWANMLQTLRRERVIKNGGQIVVRNGAEIETDKLGATRAIMLAEDTIDTDILHGSSQRIKIQNALEEALKAIDIFEAKRNRTAGELPCVVQYGFEKTVPYLQRNFRKTLARMKRTALLRNITYCAIHAAACVIQSWIRKLRQMWIYREMRIPDYDLFAAEIQRIFRGYRQRLLFSDFREAYLLKRMNNAIITIQRMIRGYLARKRVKEIRGRLLDARIEDTRQWASIVIQKRIRGRLARKTVLRSLRIRQALSQDVLHLADQYLHSGDLWGFLKEIDVRFKHMNILAERSQQQEEEWAKTFVEKVLTKRKIEFDGAWNRFSTALGKQRKSNNSNNSISDKTNNNNNYNNGQPFNSSLEENSDILSAISFDGTISLTGNSPFPIKSPHKPSQSKKKKGKVGSNPISSNINHQKQRKKAEMLVPVSVPVGVNAIPGTVLRRAVTATVKDRVAAELEKIKQSNSNLDDVRNAYRDDSKRHHPKKKHTSNQSTNRTINSDSSPTTTSANTGNNISRQKSPNKNSGGSKLYQQPNKGKGVREGGEGGGIVASSANWMAKAAALECSNDNTFTSFPSSTNYNKQSTDSSITGAIKGNHHSTTDFQREMSRHKYTRNSASQNIDKITNSQASQLQFHPSSPTQASNSNSRYNNSDSNSSVGSAIYPVNVRGPNPGESLLIDIPLGLEDTVERLIRAASVRSYVPDFFPNDTIESAYAVFLRLPQGLSRIRYEQAAWNWGQVTIDRLKNKKLCWIRDLLPASKLSMYFRGVEAPKVLEAECIRLVLELKKSNEAAKGLTHLSTIAKHTTLHNDSGTVTQVLEASSLLRPPLASKPSRTATTNINNEVDLSRNSMKDVDMTLIDKLMHQMLTQGTWTNLKMDVEDFLQQAAYFVCQHIPFSSTENTYASSSALPTSNTSDIASSDFIGTEALKSHLIELQLLKDEGDRRTAIRNRYQQAKDIVFPIVMYLKAQNINKVIDLARTDIKATLLPPILLSQVEAMINISIVTAIQSKSLRNKRLFKQSASATSTTSTPLLYDPRFQRSPFDPYGKPPRIDSLTSLISSSETSKNLSNKNNKKGSNSNSNHSSRGSKWKANKIDNDDNTIQNISVLTDIDSISDFAGPHFLPGGLWGSPGNISILEVEDEEESNEEGESSETENKIERDSVNRKNSSSSYSNSNRNADYSSANSIISTDISINNNNYDVNKQPVSIKAVRFGTNMINEIEDDEDEDNDERDEEDDDGKSIGTKEVSQSSSSQIINNPSHSTISLPDNKYTTSTIKFNRGKNKDILTSKSTTSLLSSNTTSTTTTTTTNSNNVWIEPNTKSQLNHPVIRGSYVCSHAGCYQTFSRAYTLSVHEKSHVLFSQYHQYKRNPMLFLDPGKEEMKTEKEALLAERVSLPPLIQKDFELIRQKITSASNSRLQFSKSS